MSHDCKDWPGTCNREDCENGPDQRAWDGRLAEYLTIEQDAKDAEKRRVEALTRLISECKHVDYLEGRWEKGFDVGYAKPDFRVCTSCGYAEEGWGCGYSLLGPNDYKCNKVERQEAWKYVRKFYSNSEHYELHRRRR